MANEESLLLDGLALNDGITLGMESLTMAPPRQRQDWIGAADSEAQLLLRNPLHENRKITARLAVTPQASIDVAHDKILLVLDKLQKASKTPDGIALTWTPATATRSVTFDALSGEITDLPIDWESGWLALSPEFTIELTCKPYWRGIECFNILDAFAANSIADYTFDAGAAGNVAITGGVMDAAANLTTENRFVHTASRYPVVSSQVTVKHTLGTTVTSYKAGVILKRLDASNYLEVYVDDNGTNSRLRIDRVIAGSRTNLVSTNLGARLSASTSYWVRGRIEGNTVIAEHWASAPTVTGTATLANTATLAGGDATALGSGVSGRAGLVWTPQQTAATVDDFEIAPNLFVSSAPFVTGEIAGVTGDVAALGRLIVTDAAAQSRRHAEWGLEGPLTYQAAAALLLDSDSLVTSGFAGTQTTLAGAYDPNASGNSVITATLYSTSQPTAVCGLGDLPHIGTFRVKARVHGGKNGDQVRLSWKALDGPLSSNPWASLQLTGQWEELDLGTVSIAAAILGAQRWTGQIEALGSLAGTSVTVDYVELVPVSDGYGKARATYGNVPGAMIGFDAFAATTAGNALNGRAAPLGGSWATSGDTGDLLFSDPIPGIMNTEFLIRSTVVNETTGRFGILGSTNYTDTRVDATFFYGGDLAELGLVARWVDSSNYLRLRLPMSSFTPGVQETAYLEQVVGGVVTILDQKPWTRQFGQHRMMLTVFASGRAIAQLYDVSGAVLVTLDAISSALATGGALDDGKPGIRDRATGAAIARDYANVAVSIPPAEPIAIYSAKTMQIRHDDVLRDDASSTYTGQPPSYRGSRFLVPVGTSRAFVKARRNDTESTADDNVTDRLQIQVAWTPRGLAVPR